MHIQSAMFLIMAQPKTNCIFRTFRVTESFWTKKQSCKFSKVDIMKCRPFFWFCLFWWTPYFEIAIFQQGRSEIFVFLVFPNQYMAKINSHTKSQTGIVTILFSYFRVGVVTKLPYSRVPTHSNFVLTWDFCLNLPCT